MHNYTPAVGFDTDGTYVRNNTCTVLFVLFTASPSAQVSVCKCARSARKSCVFQFKHSDISRIYLFCTLFPQGSSALPQMFSQMRTPGRNDCRQDRPRGARGGYLVSFRLLFHHTHQKCFRRFRSSHAWLWYCNTS